ncbi:Ku protein [Salipaludibacillus sp. CF4.18]|uniref:non-homologous end joining protein Ku n=1 Tax=Salipaludibacillus sp. CF4.18 TaxID=3373081 RepID=UPI003EE7A47E
MHSIWKGTLSFGLVNIPVKLHAATEDKNIKFRSLDKNTNAPIQYKKVSSETGDEVAKEDIVKAYEYGKNQFVILEDEELEELKEKNDEKSVDVIDFVNLDDIDPIYFNRSYYLSPDSGGSKAYALLRQCINNTNKIAVAKVTIRSKENLAVIRVFENTLMMESIFYPDEVRPASDVPGVPEETNLSAKEIKTAEMLIEQLTTTFDPSAYVDNYRLSVDELLQKKLAEEKDIAKPTGKPTEQVTDLMSALQASIDKSKKSKKKEDTKKKRVKKAT